jgi:plasmid stabilization system protein ParE
MYILDFNQLAKKDFSETKYWYSEKSIVAYNNFLLEIKDNLNRIADNPFIFRKIYKNIRVCSLNKFPYQIFFYIKENTVTILSIFHTSRNPSIWQNRKD